MKHPSRLAVTLLSTGLLLTTRAQLPAPPTYTGCAMPLAGHPDFLTLCEPHTCSLLRGKVDPHWAGHTLKLHGILHPPTSTQPRTIDVKDLISLGEACKATCRPAIPGRGIGPDQPDGEGATPGAVQQEPH